LEHPNWRDRITQLAKQRGANFRAIFYEAMTRTPYGKKYGVDTDIKVIEFYEYCQRFGRSMLDTWPFGLTSLDPIALGRQGTLAAIAEAMAETP
jgi:hypothetical protein